MKKNLLKVLFVGLLTVGFTGCTWWNDRVKSFQSDTKGLKRVIYVYSYTGELLTTYKGEVVRIEQDVTGTVIQLDNKRIVVSNATIITEEE